MELTRKIKVVIIFQAELSQHILEFFCADALNEAFDFEYWDCSNIIYKGNHFKYPLLRTYVHKLYSLREFKRNLKRLPKDTVISLDVHFVRQNYKFHKILSSYFPKVNFINFYTNSPDKSTPSWTKDKPYESRISTKREQNLFSKIKRKLYKSEVIRIFAKCIFHPKEGQKLIRKYYEDYERSLYQFYIISAAIDAQYRINHPDVDLYFKYLSNREEKNYLVYIDQNFPFHPDLREKHPEMNIEELANKHFKVLNQFFTRVENEYHTKVIVAAHPSLTKDDCFEGREVLHDNTVELVANCRGVLMHSSNALSYVMLYNKPVIMIYDDAIQQVPAFYNPIINVSQTYGINVINVEDFEMNNLHLDPIPRKCRDKYIQKYFGCLDAQAYVPNTKLLVQHIKSIYNDMYNPKIEE